MTDKQTNRHTHIWTFRLIERIGRFFEKNIAEAYETYLSMKDDILGDTYSSISLPGLYTGPKQHWARTDRDSVRSSTGDISCWLLGFNLKKIV